MVGCGKMFIPFPVEAPRVRQKCGTIGVVNFEKSKDEQEINYCQECVSKQKGVTK